MPFRKKLGVPATTRNWTVVQKIVVWARKNAYSYPTAMPCSCGLPSSSECHKTYQDVLVKEYSDYRYGRMHRLTVDTYCLQHPNLYMVSVKSFAAHLTGVCCALEYDNDPLLLRTLHKEWLNGNDINEQVQKPPMLEYMGSLTIQHIASAQDADEHIRLLQEWAKNTWQAYKVYHPLARAWIEDVRKKFHPSSTL